MHLGLIYEYMHNIKTCWFLTLCIFFNITIFSYIVSLSFSSDCIKSPKGDKQIFACIRYKSS